MVPCLCSCSLLYSISGYVMYFSLFSVGRTACLHHKETLKNHDVASLVIKAFVEKDTSVDQPNKVFAYIVESIIVDYFIGTVWQE